MKMKFSLFVFLHSLILAGYISGADSSEGSGRIPSIPLSELMEQSQLYHGKKVAVRGYMVIESEFSALFFDADAAQKESLEKGINIGPSLKDDFIFPIRKGYVEISGTFFVFPRDYKGIFRAEITDVTSVRKLANP